jgi:hypothetical protein
MFCRLARAGGNPHGRSGPAERFDHGAPSLRPFQGLADPPKVQGSL